jgi:hypothetical protein
MLKHQIKMLSYLNKNKHGALFCEMRTQKTLPMIKHIIIKKLYPALILCPNSAIAGWEYWLKFGCNFDEYIINNFNNDDTNKINIYNLEKLRVNPQFLSGINWKCIVLDESHNIKNPKSLLCKLLLGQKITSKKTKINKLKNFTACVDAEYKYILSGSPIEYNELDYFNQFKFLNFFKDALTYYQFRMQNFYLAGFNWKLRDVGKKIIAQCLNKCLQLTREDIGFKNKKIYVQRSIAPCSEFKRIYNKLKKEFTLEYKKEEKFTKWVLQKYIWLKKLCGGFTEDIFKFNQKVKELHYLINSELKGNKIIVRCEFIQEVELLQTYFNKHCIDNITMTGSNTKRHPILLNTFKLNKYLLLCFTTNDVLVEGVDLSYIDTLIFYSSPESSIIRKQIEDRHISLHYNKPILIIDLQYEKTLDIHIFKGLQKKYDRQKIIKQYVVQH